MSSEAPDQGAADRRLTYRFRRVTPAVPDVQATDPPATPAASRRWAVRAAWAVAAVLAVFAGCLAAALLLPRFDLGAVAARRASAALGRPVSVEGLRITPGRWIRIELDGLRLANAVEGSRPEMATLGHLSAEVEAASLLRGPVVVRRLSVQGFSLLLERGPDHRGNWSFRPARERPATESATPAGRSWFPTLLEARLVRGDVVYRTSGGRDLRTVLDEAAIWTAGDGEPVRLSATGAYNGVPVRLEGDLQPIAVLRDAAVPYGTSLRLSSGGTSLEFDGTMTEPLDVDGARGRLALRAPTLGPLLAIAGVQDGPDVSLQLAGAFERAGNLWQLTDAAGALGPDAIRAASLRLREGARGAPDDVQAELDFTRLDLNGLLGRGKAGGGTDIPLAVDRAPDTLVSARLQAAEVAYNGLRFGDASLRATLGPGRVAVEELALLYLGARVRASGAVESAGETSGLVQAEATVAGADVQAFRRVLGFGPVPLFGRLDTRLVVAGSGVTLNAAARRAHVSAAASMTGGAIAREVIEMASLDVRLLFRKARGTSRVACLLGVLDMRAGVGTVLPLRVRAADGAIAGTARFDLNRRTLDMTIGSRSSTTSDFALDVPIRVYGSFADPTVRPARWSPQGRAALAALDRVAALPPGVRDFARRSACALP